MTADTPPRTSSRLSRRERWLMALGALVAGWLCRITAATWRYRQTLGDEQLAELVAAGRPMIIACWHNRLAICGGWVLRRIVRQGVPVAALVSMSRDGELLARVAETMGYRVVRGSATRGGLQGLKRLYRILRREGCWVGTAPDGSRGPVYECKPGLVILAQMSGVSILPMAGAADRFWRLKSWDRLILPRPFARLAMVVGEPIAIAPGLSAEEIERQSRRLGERLTALTEQAEASFSRGSAAPTL